MDKWSTVLIGTALGSMQERLEKLGFFELIKEAAAPRSTEMRSARLDPIGTGGAGKKIQDWKPSTPTPTVGTQKRQRTKTFRDRPVNRTPIRLKRKVVAGPSGSGSSGSGQPVPKLELGKTFNPKSAKDLVR